MLGKCISGIWISKILLGEDPDPRMGFATLVLAESGSARHGLPPQAKNPSYAPEIGLLAFIRSSSWHSKTDWNIAISIPKGSMAMTQLHRIKIWWTSVQYKIQSLRE